MWFLMRRGLGWGLLSRLSLSLLYGHEILRMDMDAVYGRYWIGYRCVLWEYTSRLLFFFSFLFSIPLSWNSVYGYKDMDIVKPANEHAQISAQSLVNTCLSH